MMPASRQSCQDNGQRKTPSNRAGYADTIVVQLIGRFLAVALTLGVSACAARGGPPPVPRPFPGASLPPGSAPEPADAAAPSPPADAATPELFPGVVAMALGYRGVPYRNGGSDPSGFDCSGFVQYVFRQVGTVLPREVREQFRVGDVINRDEVRPGDLVFFETVSRGASHVGLAIGSGEFVHAPSSRGVVRIERLTSTYWAQRYVGARRIP
jgi:cell wall-associated NlpC family hydrolase